MRIFYRYEYELRNLCPVQDSYSKVQAFMRNNDLSHRELLFKIFEFVYTKQSRNKKSNIQRVMDAHPDCQHFFFNQPNKFIKHSDYVGITNCYPDNWNVGEYDNNTHIEIEKLITNIPKPWNLSYYVVFNQVNWLNFVYPHIEVTSLNKNRVPTLLPYSSNITIGWNAYEKKNVVYLSFEVSKGCESINKYIESASLYFGHYNYFHTYVYFNDDEAIINRSYADSLLPIIQKYDRIVYNSFHGTRSTKDKQPVSPQKVIKKMIQNSNFKYYGCENGLYSIAKIDKFHHQIKIYLDYADGCLSSAVRYTGLYFMYSLNIKDVYPVMQQDIEDYVKHSLDITGDLETNLFPIISATYPSTPDWFIYSNN